MIRPSATVSARLGRGPADEEPVADRHGGHDREPREDQAAVRQSAAKSPECARVEAGLQLEDVRDERHRARAAAGRSGEDHRLGARSKAVPPRAIVQNSTQRPRPTSLRSSAALQLPCAHGCNAACTGWPAAGAWRSARRTPRIVRTFPRSIRLRASLTCSEGPLLVLDQAQGELLVVVLCADVGHVQRHVRQVARRIAAGSAAGPRRSSGRDRRGAWRASPAERLRNDSSSSGFKTLAMNIPYPFPSGLMCARERDRESLDPPARSCQSEHRVRPRAPVHRPVGS